MVAFLLSLLAIGAGCTGLLAESPQQSAEPPEIIQLMWPEPPLKTRIKFIGNLSGERDLHTGFDWRNDLLGFLAGGPPPAAQLANPMGVALSDDGERIYVADLPQATVFKFDLANKTASAWKKETTKVGGPIGIALDGEENVYVVDTYYNVVSVLDKEGMPLRTITHPSIQRITGIAVDRKRGWIYVSNTSHQHLPDHKVKVFDLSGEYVKDLGRGKGVDEGYLLFPTYLAVGDDEHLYVADTMNARVQVFDPDSGDVVRIYGQRGNRAGQFERPKGVALDTFGNLYVVDSGWANVQIFNRRGEVLLFFGGRGRYPGLLYNPTAIAIDGRNRIYVADTQNFRLNIYELVNTTAEDSLMSSHDASQGTGATSKDG